MDEEKPKRRRRKKHSLLFPYRQNTIYLCRGHTAVFRSENTIHTLLKENFKKCNQSFSGKVFLGIRRQFRVRFSIEELISLRFSTEKNNLLFICSTLMMILAFIHNATLFLFFVIVHSLICQSTMGSTIHVVYRPS